MSAEDDLQRLRYLQLKQKQSMASTGVETKPVEDWKPDTTLPPPLSVNWDMAFAPKESDVIEYLQREGYKLVPQEGRGILFQDKEGNLYNTDKASGLIKHAPDIALGLGAAALTGGASLPAMAAGSGVRGLLGAGARLVGRGVIEGAGNATAELLRQGIGIQRGIGDELDTGNLAIAGASGAASPLISKSGNLLGRGAQWVQQKLSGVPDEVVEKARSGGGAYINSLRPSSISQTEAAQEAALRREEEVIRQLQDEFMQRLRGSSDVMDQAAENMSKAIKASDAHTSADALARESQGVFDQLSRGIGEQSPLQPYKNELSREWASRKKALTIDTESGSQLPLVDPRGRPLVVDVPETPIPLDVIHETRKAMDDKVNWAAKEGQSDVGTAAKRIGGVLRGHEQAISPLDVNIERERLAKIFDLRGNYPSIKKAIDAGDEGALSDFLFKKRSDAIESGLKVWDDVSANYGQSGFSPEYARMRARMKALDDTEQLYKDNLRTLKSDAKHTGILPSGQGAALTPVVMGALGYTAGGPTGLATGLALQSPATTLRLNQFLGWLDRQAARGSGGVGYGANAIRETALQKLIEESLR